jgi:hypothetical protein
MGEIHCLPMNGAAVLWHYHPQQVFAYTIMPTSAWCRPSVKGVVGRGDCRLGVGIAICCDHRLRRGIVPAERWPDVQAALRGEASVSQQTSQAVEGVRMVPIDDTPDEDGD